MDVEGTADQFDLRKLIHGLDRDLNDLRAGTISNADAHARARLARAAIDAMGLILRGRLMLERQAKQIAGPDGPQP